MLPFIARRLARGIVTLWGVSMIAFVLVKMLPGDPARIVCDPHYHQCTGKGLVRLRRELGLDRPYWHQYLDYANGWLHIDVPALRGLWPNFANSLELIMAALVIQAVAGIGIGIAAALRHRSWIDTLTAITTTVLFAVPAFVFGLMGLALTYQWNWFGAFDFSGLFSVTTAPPPFPRALAPVYWFHHLLLPTLALAFGGIATTALVTRGSLLETLSAEYVTTARAKGLPARMVVGKHALKIALFPVVSVIGLDLGRLFAADILIEMIWHWPGAGPILINAAVFRDGPTVLAVVVVVAAVFVIANTLVDIAYVAIDPRVRAK